MLLLVAFCHGYSYYNNNSFRLKSGCDLLLFFGVTGSIGLSSSVPFFSIADLSTFFDQFDNFQSSGFDFFSFPK